MPPPKLPPTETPGIEASEGDRATEKVGEREGIIQTPESVKEETSSADSPWDVVVRGWIDACFVCQTGPPPHVRYTRVLDGEVPGGQAEGQLALVGVADRLLPEGAIPIYRSQQEEISFLKRVVVPGNKDADVYKVVDIIEATPENP